MAEATKKTKLKNPRKPAKSPASVPVTEKSRIVELLQQIAFLKEMRNSNPFKVRAFENAAQILSGDSRDLKTLVETGALETLRGIGKGHIYNIILDFYRQGRSKDYDELLKEFPAGLFELLKIPGLGAKRIKQLYEKLGIKTAGELECACKENRLKDLEGFGVKSQENILKNIFHVQKSAGYFLLNAATEEAESALAYLRQQKGVNKIEVAGSLRRQKEIIRDLDIVISTRDPAAVHRAFVHYPKVESVVASGDTKSTVRLQSGMQCDLRTVTDAEFPSALYYFTGSKEHNVAVRTIAKKKGIKVNEYGLFRGKRRLACPDEAAIFKAVGLYEIPPELRENTGEIEWARKKPIPPLVGIQDLRGAFHVHSTYSDGKNTLASMIARAEELGWEYVGISDHSQSAFYAHGLKAARIQEQFKEIDRLQKKYKIRIFKGIESDILADGALDYPESILKQFDFVIASIHSRFSMGEKEMTRRIARAMENSYTTFLGHPTGRLLLGREGYKIEMDKIIACAKKTGVLLEVNAHPSRLDLDWRVLRQVREAGLRVSINPDAHQIDGLEDVRFGVGIARKGWLTKEQVFNTGSLSEVEKFFRQRKPK